MRGSASISSVIPRPERCDVGVGSGLAIEFRTHIAVIALIRHVSARAPAIATAQGTPRRQLAIASPNRDCSLEIPWSDAV